MLYILYMLKHLYILYVMDFMMDCVCLRQEVDLHKVTVFDTI